MTDPTPRVRDFHPANDSYNAMDIATADRRFEQLIERKERLAERSRFGVLALNGASAIGLMSNYDKVRSALEIDPRTALAFFAVGMLLAVASIFFETNFVGARAAHMFGHLSALRNVRATLDDHLTDENERRLCEQLNSIHERSTRRGTRIRLDDKKDGLPNDFVYSPSALVTMNFGASCWIIGVACLIVPMFV